MQAAQPLAEAGRRIAEFEPAGLEAVLALSSLAESPRHGYAIMQAVTEMTSGRETILPGTLYAARAQARQEAGLASSVGAGGSP